MDRLTVAAGGYRRAWWEAGNSGSRKSKLERWGEPRRNGGATIPPLRNGRRRRRSGRDDRTKKANPGARRTQEQGEPKREERGLGGAAGVYATIPPLQASKRRWLSGRDDYVN